VYIAYNPGFVFQLAVKAIAVSLFDNLEKGFTIKGLAGEAGVSEKQLHLWKKILLAEGPKLFERRRPGRKKQEILGGRSKEGEILIYESINRLLFKAKEDRKPFFLSPEFKEEVLKERRRLKEESGLAFQDFSHLIGIPESTLKFWQKKEREEGKEGLKPKSRAPKRNAQKLPGEIIEAIQAYGQSCARRGGIRNLSLFSRSFRQKYQRLLSAYGHPDISNKVIGRYLKEAGLYRRKKKKKSPGQKEEVLDTTFLLPRV